ncbi:unnamed protein product [Schistosoma curassoni]|uniref:HNH endonuclease n=1 Tax=Schistosoma curassoni TaxID=6186 RepID=A0A183L6W0_9TREM|nr:unnamed protein product [Schistosoma curassoni]
MGPIVHLGAIHMSHIRGITDQNLDFLRNFAQYD